MNGLKTNKAPHSSVVIPHFVFGAISFLILGVMLILAESNLLAAYFNNKIIAITHMAVLGWGTIIIFGALYQLIPVVFEAALFSEKLAKVTFWANVISILFLSYTFWIGSFTILLPYSAALMFISLLLFAFNVFLTYKSAKLKTIKSKFVITAIFWLIVTALIGVLISYNFTFNFFTQIHLNYLKTHAIVGFVGWFLLLIIGVGATLIPMFLVSHNVKDKKLNYSFYTINSALIIFVLNGFTININALNVISATLISIGILLFVSFLYDSYKNRLRKKLDIGMQYTFLSIVAIAIPIFTTGIMFLSKTENFSQFYRIVTFFGFTIIFGFITTLILGQTYKTLPFIIWLKKYQHLVGKTKTPLPKELYSIDIAKIQFMAYLLFIVNISIGLLLNSLWLIKIGSYLLLFVAILYNINVLKILFHKPKNLNNE